MSYIKSIHVQNIRTHESLAIDLSGGATVITGDNGVGKTSLLEAVYIALQGSSFKGADKDIVSYGKTWWRIDLEFDDGLKRTVKFDSQKQTGRKQFTINDKQMYRLSSNHKYPVVLFEPDDLRLLHGSPTRRRLFIDHFISQLDPLYSVTLRKYDRALKQRNSLLKKQYIKNDELFVWDIALSEHGAYIIQQRISFIEEINRKLNDAYNEIAQSNDIVSIHYSYTLIDSIQQKLLNELHATAEKDKILGYTSTGPHRHDVIFKYNNETAHLIASRGEVRSLILALKFLEIDIILQLTGVYPIVLLDDVFSELDEHRQKKLSIYDHQSILTTTQLSFKNKQFTEVRLT